MGEGLIVRRGGGASLNYKVVGGNSAPSSPKENTIWVNASTAITSHIFSSEQPTSPVEGMVWFEIASSSSTAFNALRKNGITVCPIGCRQYISGTWVTKDAKTYQGGKWVDWVTYLINLGDTCDALTGGWATKAIGDSADYNKPSAPTITNNGDSITIKQTTTQWYCGIYHTKNKIDLTPYSKITVVVSAINASSSSGSGGRLMIHSNYGSTLANNKLANTSQWGGSSGSVGTYSIDITDINEPAYISLRAYWGITYTVTAVYLEV